MPNAPAHKSVGHDCSCTGCFWFRHQIADPECICIVCCVDRTRMQHATNNVFSALLAKAKEDEASAEWYFDQKAKLKASQWHHNARLHYAKLAAYALGTILGFTIEEIEEQCKGDKYNRGEDDDA